MERREPPGVERGGAAAHRRPPPARLSRLLGECVASVRQGPPRARRSDPGPPVPGRWPRELYGHEAEDGTGSGRLPREHDPLGHAPRGPPRARAVSRAGMRRLGMRIDVDFNQRNAQPVGVLRSAVPEDAPMRCRSLPVLAALVLVPRIATPQGDPLGPEFRVNTHTTDRQDLPNIAADPFGGFLVVWMSDG